MTGAAHTTQPDPLASNRLTSAFERRVGRVLSRHLGGDAPLVVATSGGPDSTALLVASARARAGAGAVVAACFDHRMRPAAETAADRALVRELAGRLSVDVRTGASRTAVPPRGEAAAREARYRWLARVCADAGADACTTGHTLDDQAETVLLRLTRGAGLRGAAGMAEVAGWPVAGRGARYAALRLVRPMLTSTRDDVLEYLDALDLQPRTDETNALLTFDRNRIRHRVLSELRRINPRVGERLAQFAAQARSDDAALTAWASRELAEHGECEAGTARIERSVLRALPPAVASRVLRLAAQRIGVPLGRSHVEQLMALVARRGGRASLPGGEAITADRWIALMARPETARRSDGRDHASSVHSRDGGERSDEELDGPPHCA